MAWLRKIEKVCILANWATKWFTKAWMSAQSGPLKPLLPGRTTKWFIFNEGSVGFEEGDIRVEDSSLKTTSLSFIFMFASFHFISVLCVEPRHVVRIQYESLRIGYDRLWMLSWYNIHEGNFCFTCTLTYTHWYTYYVFDKMLIKAVWVVTLRIERKLNLCIYKL